MASRSSTNTEVGRGRQPQIAKALATLRLAEVLCEFALTTEPAAKKKYRNNRVKTGMRS